MRQGYIRDLSIQFLLGCTLTNWVKLLWQNRDKPIHIKSLPKFLYITFVIILLTPVRLIEKLFDIRVKRQKSIKANFILGHWRSGTTILSNNHRTNSLVLPIHALLWSNMFTGLCHGKSVEKFFENRHMDSVVLDTVSSQEEEFAIANMSTLSNYHLVIFPRNHYKYQKYASFHDMSESELSEWKEKYLYIIKKVTFQLKGKRLLLKSPTNTSRIKQLLELFPNARFIHISRDPYKVYASTKRLYDNFFPVFELQKRISEEESEETQFEIYENMYRKYFEERDPIPPGHLLEIRYEDVVKDPMGHIEKIYTHLGIEGFEKAKPAIKRYIESQKIISPTSMKWIRGL